jgi:hypothetical protein
MNIFSLNGLNNESIEIIRIKVAEMVDGEIRAKGILDILLKNPKDAKGKKKLLAEAKFVQDIVMVELAKTNEAKYLDLIGEILKSTGSADEIIGFLPTMSQKHGAEFISDFWMNSIDFEGNWDYWKKGVLQLLPGVIDEIGIEKVVKFWNNIWLEILNSVDDDENGYLYSFMLKNCSICLILHCPDTVQYFAEFIKNSINFDGDLETYELEHDETVDFQLEEIVRYSTILGFPELTEQYNKLGYKLIESKNQYDRLIGLNMLLASNPSDIKKFACFYFQKRSCGRSS